jgi:hypothetical protein
MSSSKSLNIPLNFFSLEKAMQQRKKQIRKVLSKTLSFLLFLRNYLSSLGSRLKRLANLIINN